MHSVRQPHPAPPNPLNSSRVPPMTGQGSYSTKTPHLAQPPPQLQQGLLPTPPPRPGQPGMYQHLPPPPPRMHSYATQQNLPYPSCFPPVSGGGLLPLPSQNQMMHRASPPKQVDDHGSTASPLWSSGIESSMQANGATVGAGSHSPADSDMEMEDDITQSENDQVVIRPIEGPRNTCDSTSSNRIDVKEHFCGGQGLVESDAYTVALSDKVLIPSSSGPDQQGPKLISGDDHLMVVRPASKDHRLVGGSAVVAVHPWSMDKDFSATRLAEDKSSSKSLAAPECTVFNKYSGQSMKGNSLFKHVQDYASDDSLIKGEERSVKGASSKVVPELVATSAEDLHKNNAGNLETDVRSKSSLSFGVHELSSDAQNEVEDVGPAGVASGTATVHADTKHEDPESVDITVSPRTSSREDGSHGPGENVALSSNYPKKNEAIGAKTASTAPKVDKFGRLVREGSGDSDSDDSLYNGRRGKRGRDHSRSWSPVGRRWRRRSPPRRRGKRSRSRSWSPKKRRSRSRSPRNQRSRSRSPRNRRSRSRSPRNRRSRSRSPRNRRSRSRSPRNRRSGSRSPVFRHTAVGSGKIRGDRAQIPDCFDFLKGKCYRGASCRYLHHDSDKTDGSRHHRNKQQFLQHHNSRNSNTHEEIKIGLLKEKDDRHQIMSREMQLNQDADSLPRGTDGSAISDSPLDKTSTTPLQKLPASGTLPSRTGYMHNSSYQPMLPASGPLLAGTNAQSTMQLTRNSNLTPQVSGVQSQHVSVEGFPHYMLPSQNSSFPVPPNSSWPSLPLPQQLPPPNPSINAGTAPPVVSVQLQPTKLPPSNDFGSQIHSRPNSTELPTQSQVGEFQHQSYPSVPELHQPLPGSSQQYGGATPFSEDCQMQLPVNGETASGSFTNVNSLTQQKPFLQKSPANEPLSFPCGNLLPGEIAKSCSQVHPCSQQQQPAFYGQFQNNGSSSRNLLDILDANQQRQMSDLGVSGNSTYHNSYASTFEVPLSSRLDSGALGQEKGTSYVSKYDHPSSLSHASVDGRGIGSVGSTQATSSQISTSGARQMIPNSSSDQYDPLFDSIEPSSNLSKNFNHSRKWQPSNDSDTLVRNSVSNKLLDVEENSKEFGGIALATSVDDEEFGETADVEVEDVDNVSRSSPNAIANVNLGEMEIDQIKSSENSKKSKESRSMKLFKVCLANFVKEVLKPSWRQGNMSKETFKIVVKKTVDKVSEAMESHHIPKSKAKIDHYIDSQQRKLTKLVMGYVDKYAKG